MKMDRGQKKKTEKGFRRTLAMVLACVMLAMPGFTLLAPSGAAEEYYYFLDYIFECQYEPKTGEGYAGYAVHTHDTSCYDGYYELVCNLPQIPVHIHDAGCRDSSGALICGKLELHTHTDACFTDGVWTCGIPELEEHVHGPECFLEVVAAMNMETGEQTVASIPGADLETVEDWQNLMSEVRLTGDHHKDLIAVSESQLGYHESTQNIAWTGEFEGGHYNRYGAWYGYPYGAWCAMFVSFCLYYAGIPKEVFPYDSGTINWVDTLKNLGMFGDALTYEPVPGDIVFFDFDDGRADHVGIVRKVDGDTLYTIEGNRTNRVEEFEYSNYRSNRHFLGYGILP